MAQVGQLQPEQRPHLNAFDGLEPNSKSNNNPHNHNSSRHNGGHNSMSPPSTIGAYSPNVMDEEKAGYDRRRTGKSRSWWKCFAIGAVLLGLIIILTVGVLAFTLRSKLENKMQTTSSPGPPKHHRPEEMVAGTEAPTHSSKISAFAPHSRTSSSSSEQPTTTPAHEEHQTKEDKSNANGSILPVIITATTGTTSSITTTTESTSTKQSEVPTTVHSHESSHTHGLVNSNPLAVEGNRVFHNASSTSVESHDEEAVDPHHSRGLRWPEPSGSLHASYKRAAIATDHGLCSEIGRDVMLEGGNAVDATIAAMLCIGVVNPQSAGIGGGFIMTLFNASTARCMSVDAREMAPLSANSTMFQRNHNDSLEGYKSIAVPGEVHGLWTVYSRYGSGRISWKRLLTPSIRLAREGFPVSSNLAMVLQIKEEKIMENEPMKQTFVDHRTGRVYEEGDIMKRERLAELLDELADAADPVALFYREGIAQTIAAEIKDHGGFIGVEDLSAYETIIHEQPLESELLPDEMVMCGPPPPSSFAISQAIVGVMAHIYHDYPRRHSPVDFDSPLLYHRLIEAEKFAYAQRTKLGDISFVRSARAVARNMTRHAYARWVASLIKSEAQPLQYYSRDLTTHVPDHGTSHTTAIDHEGNAVSVTATINQLLGSKRLSPTLGFIWNDEMDDFSTPNATNAFGFTPSPENFIMPRKRPMSSMAPMIVYNKASGKVRWVAGASGGSRIISAVAQATIRALLFNQTVKEAIDAPRFHNQFLPPVTEYEHSVPREIIRGLVQKHHQRNLTAIEKQASVVQALLVMDDGFIHGNSDFRRKTSTYPAGY